MGVHGGARLRHVALRKGVEYVLESRADQAAQPIDAVHGRGRRGRLGEHDAALGGILGIVGDAFQRRGDPDRGQDHAQALRQRKRHRLALPHHRLRGRCDHPLHPGPHDHGAGAGRQPCRAG